MANMEHRSATQRVWRVLNSVGILAMVIVFLPYVASPYPCRMTSLELEVRPTDQYGKLEYCAYEVHWNKSAKYYEPLASPICGEDKAVTQQRAKAREAAMLAADQACKDNLPGPLDAWRNWWSPALDYVKDLKG